jgi:exoribonuclease R
MDIHTGLTAVHRTWTAVDMGRGVACSLVRGGDLDVRRVVRVSPKVPGVDRATLRRGISAIQEEMRIDAEFPAAALAEAEEAARNPVLPGLDRTDIPFLTIDPESARDLDQALHIERRGAGYRVFYAIADVAAFVRPGGAIDAEANRRGETLYGGETKVPLHPPAISERAASLLPDGDRPALLWTIDVDEAGEGVDVQVERAMVRSRAKLTYAQAQADLDSERASPTFQLLREVGTLRLAREKERGGVSLPLPDQEVDLSEDGRWVLRFREARPVEDWNAHISLLTGMGAAYLMIRGGVGILRTLSPADPRDVARLRRVAHALRVAWPDERSYPDFIRSLDPRRAADAAMLNASTALLRGAGYVGFRGELPEQPVHAALAGEYAHVTAPIRRLVDRYAGEIAVSLCAGVPVPDWVLARLEDLPATMSESSRRANRYERAILDLMEATVLHDRVGEMFEGIVVDLNDRDPHEGEVVIAEPAIEAPLTSRGDRPLPLGAEVTVRLTQADPSERRIRFELP